MIEHDHGDVLERHARRLRLLDDQGEMLALELGRVGDTTTLRQTTARLRLGGVDVAENIDVEFLDTRV